MNLDALAPACATSDTLFEGRLRLTQPTVGHRATVDTLLLATFAGGLRAPKTVLDLGAGAGALTLVLHHLGVDARFSLVDVSSTACELARNNLTQAGLSHRVWCHDLSTGLPTECRRIAELVVLNPPYFEPGSARAPRNAQHTRIGALGPFLQSARDGLAQRGSVAACYPAAALQTLLGTAASVGLHAKRLRLVHAFAARPARLALAEFKPGRGGGLEVLPPLVEWHAPSKRSAELECIIAGRRVDRA